MLIVKFKLNLHYTRCITPKRVTSGGIHLRGLAPGQHSSEETSQLQRNEEMSQLRRIVTAPTTQLQRNEETLQRWRAVDDTVLI